MATKSCTGCSSNPEEISVPYLAHESVLARFERIIKRQWITIIILIALVFGSNLAWIIYESQFEYEAEVNEGGNAVINDDGEVNIDGKSTEDDSN